MFSVRTGEFEKSSIIKFARFAPIIPDREKMISERNIRGDQHEFEMYFFPVTGDAQFKAMKKLMKKFRNFTKISGTTAKTLMSHSLLSPIICSQF